MKNSELSRVKKALSNPNYTWRTVSGIAREVSLPVDKVNKALVQLERKGLVIQNSKDVSLFITPKQYYKPKNIVRRILSVLSDKIR